VSNQREPNTVSPADSIKQFPGECLEAKHGKLLCVACREELSIKNHIYSGNKHQDTKDRLAKKDARECDIADSLVVYDKAEQPAGTSVSLGERVYWVKVVENLLRAGIPPVKVDDLRDLSENGLKLTHSFHLADCIPLLLKREKETLKNEINGCLFLLYSM